MKNIEELISLLSSMSLFKGVEESDYKYILEFFSAKTKEYKKGSIIKGLWEHVKDAGLIIEGSVIIKFLSDYGSEHRITKVQKGSVFALSFACSKKGGGESMEVVADENCKIMYLTLSKLFLEKKDFSPALEQVSINLLAELAEKNVFLNKKVEILSHHKIRDRLIVFLKMMSKGKKEFVVPLNREQMSSFLGVERSSLSRELSKMKSDGLIDYNGKQFVIY